MDNRHPLGRGTPSSVPQSPYNNNMASGYPIPSYNNHLPPISTYAPNMPPQHQAYMPQYRPELTRYQSAPAPAGTPDRYNAHMAHHPMGGLPPASMLPQPTSQAPQQSGYSTPPSVNPAYPPPQGQSGPRIAPALAPAPPRPNLDPLATNFNQAQDRPQMWTGNDQMPPMAHDGMGGMARDPNVHRVVGSQGRRGILPSAPGGAPVATNGMNGSPKANAMPVKDADGKFPCPNCNKTYLHAKHLKRHMLRHTGDRPYMCVLCNDTFSRSDILKRHFQKCSVRRGNPTGASHLSNPAAHLKKSQAAAAKANAESPASSATPSTSGLPAGAFTSTAMGAPSMPATSAPYSDAPPMPYNMANAPPGDMHRSQANQPPPPSGSNPGPGAWPMQNPRGPMYNPGQPPDQYSIGHGGPDDKRNVMQGAHPMHHEEWPNMFHGGNEAYMNPIFAGYDHQGHHDGKKEFGGHDGGHQNGYYVSSTDGTQYGPSLWQNSLEADPLQLKSDRLVDFCFPAGALQDENNLSICLTAEYVKHFLELFTNFQGHFPYLHVPTFKFLEAYDGVILAIICIGAVYSDRVSQQQVRELMQRTREGIHRTSRLLNTQDWTNLDPRLLLAGVEFEELQALLMLQTISIWHGRADQRAAARQDSDYLFDLVKRLQMLELASPDDTIAFSYLHHIHNPQQIHDSRYQWNWYSWIEQEKRSRFMYLVYLLDAALVIYFNCIPQFAPTDIGLPLPCDDEAWDAVDADACAIALGLCGTDAQREVNSTGSLRPNQMHLQEAMAVLHNASATVEPRSTNVYSKFILIHGLHTEIWQVQKQSSLASSTNTDPTDQSPSGPLATLARQYKSLGTAIIRWKDSWDMDMQIQYPAGPDHKNTPRRRGFSRDGVHFYWLAQAFLKPPRALDWRLPADVRFQQVMHGLMKAREWARTDGYQRGEEPGSVYDIEDDYASDGIELDMRKLFRPLTPPAQTGQRSVLKQQEL